MPKKEESKRKGRYTKENIEDWTTPEKLILITGWCMDGYTNEEIAKKMGIGLSTLNGWIAKDSNISNALKKGKEICDYEVEQNLYKSTKDHIVEVTKKQIVKDKDGEKQYITITEQVIPANVTAQLSWLNNRRRDKWSNRQVLDTPEERKPVDININVIDNTDLEKVMYERRNESGKES